MSRPFFAIVVCFFVVAVNVVRAEDLPADARALIAQNRKTVAEIERTATQQTKAANDTLLTDLEKLKIAYTKEGKLDEAVAIRDYLRAGVNQASIKSIPDPGVLTTYRSEVGRVLYIDVTGASNYSVYGTDVYTHDSNLSAAAVHAGVLKYGESGIVKVTILPAQGDFKGTGRNGVSSGSWNATYECYKVEPLHARPVGGTAKAAGAVKDTVAGEKTSISKEVDELKNALQKVDSVQGALNKLEAVKDALKK